MLTRNTAKLGCCLGQYSNYGQEAGILFVLFRTLGKESTIFSCFVQDNGAVPARNPGVLNAGGPNIQEEEDEGRF